MGLPARAVNEFQNNYGADVNAFFPSRITIHRGDKVRFRPVGFHTLDIPRRGGRPLPLIAPTGQAVSGVNDENGTAFWFNGQDQVGFNPAIATKNLFGKTRTYRNRRIESGLPLGPNLKPVTVRFKKRGIYRYYCDVHPGMNARVVVKRKNAKVPTAKQDRKRVRKQLRQARNRAKTLAGYVPPGNAVYVGNSAPGGVEFFGMLPAKKTVPIGTTVRFMMSPLSRDVHTASFGPPGESPEQPNTYLGQIAQTFTGGPVIDPRGIYPSEQPPSVANYTAALHGNGFWNSGVMDTAAASPPAPYNDLKFTAAGTYDFYCLIHPFMHGRVEVTP